MLASNSHGKYTVIDAHLGILAHKLTREDAIQAVLDAVDDAPPAEVAAMLDATPDPAAWRTEWAAATAVELRKLETRVDDSVTYADLLQLREQMLDEQREALKGIEIDAKSRTLEAVREQLNAEHRRLIQLLADENEIDFDDALASYNQVVWRHLRSTKLYRQFLRLSKEVA